MHHSKRGTALLSALILGSVLLGTLAALIGTALSEYRGATRLSMNSVAFSLAEAGIDRAAAISYTDTFGTAPGWTNLATNTYTKTFTADSASIGQMTGEYEVVVSKTVDSATRSTFKISSKGSVTNAGGAMTAQRAVQVTFTREILAGQGSGMGCVSRSTFAAGSTSGNISASQIGPTFDAYSSAFGGAANTAPSSLNRNNQCTVGTGSSANNALNLVNGQYFCTVGTGNSTSNPTPTVAFATSNGASLAQIDDHATATTTANLKPYDGTSNTEKLLKRDVVVNVPSVVPVAASTSAGWQIVTPSTSASTSSQWYMNGKITDYGTGTTVSYSGSTLTLGSQDTDKVYVTTNGMDNISKIDVSGEVILVVNCPINSSNLTVNYKTTNAKLSIYTNNNVGGVVLTTQQLNGASATTQNWEADRLGIYVLPSSTNLNACSVVTAASAANNWKATLASPADIAGYAQTAVTNAGTATTGGTSITMNFDSNNVFVGSFIAPYSQVQLSATGTNRGTGTGYKMSDYCGSLIAGSLLINGSNGFAFHFDQSLGGGGTNNPVFTLSQWNQISPTNAVFN